MQGRLRVLAIEPFYGGSHAQFLDDWRSVSRHEWTVWSLPDRHWKWRMRQAALYFAEQFRRSEMTWDVLWASGMLNLSEFLGLAPAAAQLPSVLYFHENQLTYPVQEERERDLHYAFTNVSSALAADRIWFNSAYHRDEFLGAVDPWLAQFPGPRLTAVPASMASRASVQSPGVPPPAKPPSTRAAASGEPLHVVWAARWEHDKNPASFFAALRRSLQRESLTVSVLGQSYRQTPECFEEARTEFAGAIRQWGFLDSRADYEQALGDADVFVSTADHEFFGLSAVEALFRSQRVLFPRRLSYPELLGPELTPLFTYESSLDDRDREINALADQLVHWASAKRCGAWVSGQPDLYAAAARYEATRRADQMDEALASLVNRRVSTALKGGAEST